MNFIKKNLLLAKKLIGFNDGLLIIGGILAISFVLPLIFFKQDMHNGFVNYCPHWFIGILYTSIFWMGDRHIMMYFLKKYRDLKDNRKRVIRQSIGILSYTILATLVLGLMESSIISYFDLPQPEHSKLAALGASLFATVTVVSIYEALYYISQWKNSIAEAEQLKREHVQSQLSSLRNQVNPHFLFNSLNTLSSLIPENPEKAIHFVQNLSQVYRYILELGDKELISLQDEMNAVNAYLFLLNTRFSENLVINITISEESLHKKVVPLAVQMLIENAVKHNIISSKRPLHISIASKNNTELVVSNNLQIKDQAQDGTGTGLKNIGHRYQILSGKSFAFGIHDQNFIVTLPLLDLDE
jgi:sensor histidine kinase YesM